MKITVLAENTAVSPEYFYEHGLSLYIETKHHKILFDMGQSDVYRKNAEKLNIDLKAVDIAVISHGHYDHGGGLADFLKINTTAPVYISDKAFGEHYNGTEKYIGLDKSLIKSSRLIFNKDSLIIDDELSLFCFNNEKSVFSSDTTGLNVKLGNDFYEDKFLHEQYLIINNNDKKILISGCSHKGILNIQSFASADYLIGGFHLSKLSIDDESDRLKAISAELLKHNTKYYTAHCTGVNQYKFLKSIMGERLEYLSSGSYIEI